MKRGECQVSSDKWIEAKKKHLRKKITVLTLCAMLFSLCSSAAAQQPAKVPRIGFLTGSPSVFPGRIMEQLDTGSAEEWTSAFTLPDWTHEEREGIFT